MSVIEQEQQAELYFHDISTVSGAINLTVSAQRPRLSTISLSPVYYRYLIQVWESISKHYERLVQMKEKGMITNEEMNEILLQHRLLLEHTKELQNHQGKVAVMCNGDLFIGDTLQETVKKSREKHGNKPYYSESINLIDIPSLFRINADSV
jgi:hypothetical protein